MDDQADFLDVLREFTLQYSQKVETVSDRQLDNDFYAFAAADGIQCLMHPNEQYVQTSGAVIPTPEVFSDDDSIELVIRTAAYLEGSTPIVSDASPHQFNGPLTENYEQHGNYAQLIKTNRTNKFYLFISVPVFTLYDARPYPDRTDWIQGFFQDVDWALTRIVEGDVAATSILEDMDDAQLESRGIRRYFQIVSNSLEEMVERQTSLEDRLRSAQDSAMGYAQQVLNLREQIAAYNPDSGKTDLASIKNPQMQSIISKKDDNNVWYIEIITVPLFMQPSSNPENLPIPDEGIAIGQVEARIYLHNGASNPFQFLQHGEQTVGRRRRNIVHPHVLSGNRPCLGGFGDTVIDCVSKGDLETLVDVMFMFLEQANTEDSAGKTWPHWLTTGRFDSVGDNDTQADAIPEPPEYIQMTGTTATA